MSIDNKPPSAWDEADLQEVCDEHRRETQTLEFKRELHLDTTGQKNDAEHDALGMATGAGGVIVYGIAEAVLPDGARTADRLSPLTDGTLPDRLQDVLDSRGQPRLPFELHEVRLADGGFMLILEVFGRRRPHQAQDGRYYERRGTNVRPITEAELAEAYRERFLRDARALQGLALGQDASALPADVEARIHRGLKPNELALWREETGEADLPGWLTAVALPMPPERGVLEPVRDAHLFQTPIDIDDRWDEDNAPLQYFRLRPVGDRLFDQLPSRDDAAPSNLVSMYGDGLMEYGTTLEPRSATRTPTATGSSSVAAIRSRPTITCSRSPSPSAGSSTKAPSRRRSASSTRAERASSLAQGVVSVCIPSTMSTFAGRCGEANGRTCCIARV